jgi:hypothetical protein
MRFRGRSIRRKIVGLLLVPLVSLTSIWAFATLVTGRDVVRLMDAATVVDTVGTPADDTVRLLQEERRQTLVHLADPRTSDGLMRVHRSGQATDRAVGRLRAAAGSADIRERMRESAVGRLDVVLDGLTELDGLRRKVEEGTVSRGVAFAAYNEVIDPCFDLLDALHALEDVEMDKQGRALVGIGRARELLAREDALLASALAVGRLPAGELRSITDLIAGRTVLYSTNLPLLRPEEREAFEEYWRGPGTTDLLRTEQRVAEAGSGHALDGVDDERWQAAVGTVLGTLERMSAKTERHHQDLLEPSAARALALAGIAGGLGFAAVLTSIIVSVRIGRGLVRDLNRLRREAHEASGVRLPSVMRRLAAGERVGVDAEAPRREYSQDEMGQVGQALNTLQRAAVEAAVKQAALRSGVSEVFVNLARRNQVLLHRQLTLLDAMERRTDDTEELADLFRLDHLTTRMRRHAEGLVILSGAAASRQWRKPIRLLDVVRAAVAEVEDYERIEVRRLPRIAVTGSAVSDLTHLVAELLENATVFSPPHTTVQVMGEPVANGFTLEIHDRGLGMAADALLDANLRLAETPEFELSDTDRLGLFVVSRLAQRQGVRVSLQPSPYGGTTAVVFIPAELLTEPVPGNAPSGGDEDTGERPLPGTGRFTALTAELSRPSGSHREPSAFGGRPEREAPLIVMDRESSDPAGRSGSRAVPGDRGFGPEPDPLPRRLSPVLVSDHGRPVADRGRAGTSEQEEAPARRGPAETAGPSIEGLPRRVRQANLAPQLRTRPPAREGGAPGLDDTDAERDAEAVRSRMASLQRGWQRGRADTGEALGTTGNTAPGTTPEGDGR